jgi:hypothetical protein
VYNASESSKAEQNPCFCTDSVLVDQKFAANSCNVNQRLCQDVEAEAEEGEVDGEDVEAGEVPQALGPAQLRTKAGHTASCNH